MEETSQTRAEGMQILLAACGKTQEERKVLETKFVMASGVGLKDLENCHPSQVKD
jgi:hypothetical protein